MLVQKSFEYTLNIGDCWETQISKAISRCAE